jgi:hypothetical protein
MKERINEHDMTKKMMSMIRGGYQNVLVKENSDDVKAVEIEKNTPIYKDELKKLKEIVYPIAVIKSITVSKQGDSRNVNMKVVFLEGDEGSGVNDNQSDRQQMPTWVNQDNRSGVYFEMDLLKGFEDPIVKNVSNPKLPEILNKLEGYYDVWATEWAKQNIDDYLK